ncbi:uncharacterized protein N7511_003344 [Penicillium nucicola]|uniref:uncharacterized protein n=1 Tax=Penicillium nucicola TaxID=1850975 RepID=UPI0025450401|nr:uncharacterized protein N7511_003344 [Penicillium nucicola]KAJ5771293.1 hypothetical protein N7511_003344 [Penicillium nucicola]
MKRYQQHTHASWHKAYADNHDCPWCLENPSLRDNVGPPSRPQSKLRTRVPTRNGHSRMETASPSLSVHAQQQPMKYEQEHQNEEEHYEHQSLPEGQVADSQVESHTPTADFADDDAAHFENDVASHDVEDASHVNEQEGQSLNEVVDDSVLGADRQFSPEVSDDRTTSEQ